MSRTADRLADLTPAQRELVQRRMAARRSDGQIPPRKAPEAPLSFTQQRLWFVQTLSPENTAYNLMSALRLRGPLDEAAMGRAFAALTERHEALRMRYAAGADGSPRQYPAPAPILQMTDLSETADPESAARDRLATIIAAPHALSGVPVRAGLLRLGPQDHIFALGLHHIVADRWSVGVLIRDFSMLYDADCRGRSAPLSPLPLQMPDFAAWQRATQMGELDRQISYWRKQLEGAPTLDLPRKLRRDTTAASGLHSFGLPAQLTDALRLSARRRGISLFPLLLAGFNLLLARYCDSDDIVVGSDVSNRDRTETQGMVGPLVNTLVLRTVLQGAEDFDAVLQRTAAVIRAALGHQDVPLEQVVEALNPDRMTDEVTPLFRAKFDLQQAERLPETVSGLSLERFDGEPQAAKFELRFNLEDDGRHITGRVEYRADLYEPAVIGRMTQHYIRLLEAALAAPALPPNDLAMLSGPEHAEMIALSQGPDLPHLSADTLHQAFEAQVDRTPDAPALTSGSTTLSYRELDALANRTAAALVARGLPPGSCIGVSMGRSSTLVAAILGVLKAGHAYVPLDPTYPRLRLDMIVANAGLSLVLTDRAGTSIDAELLDPTTLAPADRPTSQATGSDLAVVIYTSGTTGTPKGVALEHCNILARVAWASRQYEAADLAGVLFATSVSFDLSLFEIFATLSLGGRLVLAQSLLDLPRLGPDAGVTFLNSVPSVLRDLVDHHDLPQSVRVISLAGEFFPPTLLDRLKTFPQIRTINNLYGPTEDAIYDAGNPVQDEPERPMPIGRPFPGSRLYILDRNGAILPRGVVGEICTGGAGLSRGYLNRDKLTAEKFQPDPFRPGARLYRSGDRGLWREDGRIDILGRIDTQVKIRGQRIETGAIEAALETHPDIAEVAVLATGDAAEPNRQLIAYVAQRPERMITEDALRSYVAARLPAYMIPALWQTMDRLPRMPNGKVDRRALPAPALRDASASVPPKTETEAMVIAIWADLLGRDDIGAEDNFFARGGHSLLAMRLLIRLQEASGIELTLGQIFDALTPRKQAEVIARLQDVSLPARAGTDADSTDDLVSVLSDAEVDALLAQMSEPVEQIS